MKNVLILLRKDVLRFVADKPALLLTFILPPVLILIFGLIFGGSGEPQSKIKIIFVNESKSPLALTLEEKLDSSDVLKPVKEFTPEESKVPQRFDEETAVRFVKEGKYSTAIVLPEDFYTDTSSALRIKIFYDPKNAIESSLIQGAIQKTIFTQMSSLFPALMTKRAKKTLKGSKSVSFENEMAEIIGKYFNVSKDTIVKYFSEENIVKNPSGENFIGNIINIESKQVVGESVNNPGVTRMAGGWASMFLLFSIVGASLTLFEEKQEGSLKRLLCMPVTRSQILWSKYVFSTTLGIVQLLTMFVFTWLFFGVDIFTNFGNLFIVIVVSSMAAVSFGMLITSTVKSIQQANGIATIIILIMSAIGGAWFPVSFLPGWMQTVAKFTITYWSVDAFLQVLWRNVAFSGIALHVLILASVGVVVTFYSVIRFRKGNIF